LPTPQQTKTGTLNRANYGPLLDLNNTAGT